MSKKSGGKDYPGPGALEVVTILTFVFSIYYLPFELLLRIGEVVPGSVKGSFCTFENPFFLDAVVSLAPTPLGL